MKDKLLIFFTRIPRPGTTKTRMSPFLNKYQAVEMQKAFIKDIYQEIKELTEDILVSYCNDEDLNELKKLLNHRQPIFAKQEGNNLGKRMSNIINSSLKAYKKVILIGSDLPLIRKQDIEDAFKVLKDKDMVIGPTYDGGYYLIGMKEKADEIFNMEYGGASVFIETISKMEELGLSYGFAKKQLDIDDKKDFLNLYRLLEEDKSLEPKYTKEFVYSFMKESIYHEQN